MKLSALLGASGGQVFDWTLVPDQAVLFMPCYLQSPL